MTDISFSLFAPYNKEAALIGDFSNWEPLEMTKNEQGVFETSVELEDGQYHYKFRVRSKSWFLEEDEWVDVVDPYATHVEDSETPSAILTVENGERILDTYEWQHDDTPLAPDHQLIIYEVHVGDFSGGEGGDDAKGRYTNVIEKLDYLSDLGITAIELMPIEEFPGDQSWGYNPRYFFATESSYGTSAELKELVDACHARGIRVIKDGVYNHSESSSPLTQIDHDYWYHHEPQDSENNWGPEFNYEKYDENLDTFPARKFVGDAVRYWVANYHIDGIRYDAARQLDNFEFMQWVNNEAKHAAGEKPFFTIAEYIPEDPSVTGPDGPMDSVWHESFYYTMKDVMQGNTGDLEGVKDVLDARRRGFPGGNNVVNFLSSHDHNHVMADLGEAGILDEEAFKRVKLGADLMFTAIGIPMIWMGEEFGEASTKTTEVNKLSWPLLQNELNADLHATFRGLINLRKNNSALFGTNLDFFHEDEDAKVLAYVRWNDEGSRVVIIVNLSGDYLKDYTIPNIPADGVWHEWSQDYDLEAHDGTLTLDLPDYEAKVLVK